jgi:CRP/FNR family transcriptional regulator, cyclic AMP receptor protein
MSTRPGGLLMADSLAEIVSAPRGSLPRASAQVLREVPLFADLSDRHLRGVSRLAMVAAFREGAIVVREGARGHSFFVVLDGRARVERAGASVATLATGDHFGEMALLDGEPRSASVIAETDLTTLRIAADPFRKLLRREPSLALALLRTLSLRVRRLEG